MAAAGSNAEDQALYDAVYAVGKEFCPALGIAIPVGKDSLSMKTHWRDGEQDRAVVSPLTLIASAFAPVSDVRRLWIRSLWTIVNRFFVNSLRVIQVGKRLRRSMDK